MGQYYHPVLLKKNGEICKAFSSYEYDNGAKLMEHSYIGNGLVKAVELALKNKKYSLIWAGDYADEDWYFRPTDEQYVKNEGKNLITKDTESPRYIINHTKKVYIDKEKIKNKDEYGFIIHPLPLLTSMGNGRGGGDYKGTNMDMVGSWAKDIISTADDINETYIIPNDYKEFSITFKEDY